MAIPGAYRDFAYRLGTGEWWLKFIRGSWVGFIVTNLYPPKGIVRFYNGRGRRSSGSRSNWTRLSCHKFVANQVRLALFVLAYNLGNFLRRLALPESMKHWAFRPG